MAMDTSRRTSPTHYVIRLGCQLEPGAAVWFEGLTITNLAEGESLLTGPVVDQAALHGILARIRDLGLPLFSIGPSASVEPRSESDREDFADQPQEPSYLKGPRA
jgi:hypothetical protein